jgi:DNA-binding MarR family transcriptional regulator
MKRSTTEAKLEEQAMELERLLPLLMRRLFTLEPDHPAMELPLAQLRVCMILQMGARTLSELSRELGISVSAVTQLTDRLECAGLVERVMGTEDRRTRQVQLTAAGAETMCKRQTARVAKVVRALEYLPPEQGEEILGCIRALLHAATAVAPPPPFDDLITVRQET